jgi:hypothetical protein
MLINFPVTVHYHNLYICIALCSSWLVLIFTRPMGGCDSGVIGAVGKQRCTVRGPTLSCYEFLCGWMGFNIYYEL